MSYGPDFFYSNGESTSVISASYTTVQLLAANDNRNAFWIYNHSQSPLFFKVGPSASLEDFSVKVNSGTLFQMSTPCPRSEITAVWGDGHGSGSAMLTFIE